MYTRYSCKTLRITIFMTGNPVFFLYIQTYIPFCVLSGDYKYVILSTCSTNVYYYLPTQRKETVSDLNYSKWG